MIFSLKRVFFFLIFFLFLAGFVFAGGKNDETSEEVEDTEETTEEPVVEEETDEDIEEEPEETEEEEEEEPEETKDFIVNGKEDGKTQIDVNFHLGMGVASFDDITYFVKFNLQKLDIALRSFEEYVEKTKSDNKKILETIKRNRDLNFRQADVIITLSKNERPITIKEMEERYDITYQTARTDLLGLVELGYLQLHKDKKQFIFSLDKDRCLSSMSTSDKNQQTIYDYDP